MRCLCFRDDSATGPQVWGGPGGARRAVDRLQRALSYAPEGDRRRAVLDAAGWNSHGRVCH